jgi:hypothetical protein
MAPRGEDAVVSTNGHEGNEEAECPQGHKNDPCDDEWAISEDAEDLVVEEGNGGFDGPDGENTGHNERVIVLAVIQQHLNIDADGSTHHACFVKKIDCGCRVCFLQRCNPQLQTRHLQHLLTGSKQSPKFFAYDTS